MADQLLTVAEVAELMRVTRTAVYRWVADGRLPVLRAGKRLRFRVEDVERFMLRGRR